MVDSRFLELIAHLWRDGKYGYFWTPDDGTGAKYTYWLTLPAREDLPKLFLDKDAYFAVNPVNMRRSEFERGRNIDVTVVNGFFCEFDCPTPKAKAEAAKKIQAWKIPASCVIDSGGGYHVYIFLRSPLTDPARAAELQWAFAQWAGGDTSVNDLARVLRIPGTTNYKPKYAPNYPIVTIVEFDLTRQYELADLEPLLQPYIDQRNSTKAHTPPLSSPGAVSLSDAELWEVLFRSKNGAIHEGLWRGNLDAHNGDHSDCDQYLCNGLAWVTGRDIARMDAMFRQSGLMRPKWEQKAYRERTLSNAANSAQTVYDPNHGVDQDAVNAAQAFAASGGSGNGSQPPPSNNGSGAAPTPTPAPKAKRRKSTVTYAEIGRDYIRRNPDTIFSRGQWLRYEAGVWATIHDLTIAREIWELLERYADDIDPSINGVNNVESFVRSQVYISEDQLDNDAQLINLKTGTYSLELQTLLTHDRNRYLTTQLPFGYDPLIQAPYWRQYLETTFVDKSGKPDPELIALVQEAIGYSLTTDIRYHVTFWCYGEGANGKGVLFYILEQLAGSSAIPFNVDLLHREQYQLADLAGKRIALCPEADTNSMVEDAIIKALVAGDSLQVRQIRREPFTLRPTVKLWWSMNKLPTVTDTSTGLWRRIKMLPFYADFEGRDRKNRIDDLKERLKDELPGIFNWAMEGLARLTSNEAFTPSKLADELTASYREEANTIATFIGETCETDPTYNVGSDTIYKRYREWCTDNGYKPYNVRNFKVEMERLKYFWRRTNAIRVFDGVRLKGQGNAIP